MLYKSKRIAVEYAFFLDGRCSFDMVTYWTQLIQIIKHINKY
jgi:hypothetical protein